MLDLGQRDAVLSEFGDIGSLVDHGRRRPSAEFFQQCPLVILASRSFFLLLEQILEQIPQFLDSHRRLAILAIRLDCFMRYDRNDRHGRRARICAGEVAECVLG